MGHHSTYEPTNKTIETKCKDFEPWLNSNTWGLREHEQPINKEILKSIQLMGRDPEEEKKEKFR